MVRFGEFYFQYCSNLLGWETSLRCRKPVHQGSLRWNFGSFGWLRGRWNGEHRWIPNGYQLAAQAPSQCVPGEPWYIQFAIPWQRHSVSFTIYEKHCVFLKTSCFFKNPPNTLKILQLSAPQGPGVGLKLPTIGGDVVRYRIIMVYKSTVYKSCQLQIMYIPLYI